MMSGRGVIFIGISIMNIGLLTIGFTTEGHFNFTVMVSIFGMCLFGLGMCLNTVPIMPEILNAIEVKYKEK